MRWESAAGRRATGSEDGPAVRDAGVIIASVASAAEDVAPVRREGGQRRAFRLVRAVLKSEFVQVSCLPQTSLPAKETERACSGKHLGISGCAGGALSAGLLGLVGSGGLHQQK